MEENKIEKHDDKEDKGNIYKVPYGFKVSVQIIRNKELDEAKVKVFAPMYVNKEHILSVIYSSKDFSDRKILKDSDFVKIMFNMYGQL